MSPKFRFENLSGVNAALRHFNIASSVGFIASAQA
jgi:hypothetical protein